MAVKPSHELPVCGARTQQGKLCQNKAGFGTKTPGEGRCKWHGGCSTGPKDQEGNKNAVRTGEFEAIWLDQLDDEELELVGEVKTDKLAQVNTELALVEIRERRMLKRLAKLQAGPEMVPSEHSEGQSDKDGRHHETKSEHRDHRIERLEDGLTRVQAYKAKLIQLKHEIEKAAKDDPSAQSGIAALVDALQRSREAMKEKTE